MSRDRHSRWGRRGTALAALVALSSMLLSAMAACAASDERAEAPRPDGSLVIPSNDAGEDVSLDAAPDADACAVGEVCRATAALPLASITAMSGRSKNDVWASGSAGLLLHWDGERWSELESRINETLTSLLLTPEELWGVSGQLALRRGLEPDSIRTARITDFGTFLEGIVVLQGGDAYVGVQAGWSYFSKIDIATGSLLPEPEVIHPLTQEWQWSVLPRALFLVPDRALWLVGEHGTVARYPLSPATEGGAPPLGQGVIVPVASQANLLAAWGRDEHLWAAGTNGTILHFDGTKWHYERTGTSATLHAIFGIDLGDIWAAGDDGTVLHFDGETWSLVGVGSYRGSLRTIWGAASDDVWFGGESGIFHWGTAP